MSTDQHALIAAPGSTAALRQANEQRLVDLLRTSAGQPVTQADVARSTGLASATVSNIVRDLVAAGVLETTPGAGRRGTVLRLARTAGVVAAVDFGHTHVWVAVGDLMGGILGEFSEPIDQAHDHRDGLRRAEELLDQVLQEAGVPRTLLRAVCLGLPGPIDDGHVRSLGILPGWVGVDAVKVAGETFGVRVLVENDANLGAVAEHRLGAAQGSSNVVFVKASSGVGGGLIVNGELFRGSRGTAGEIGHLALNENGPVCRCGNRGCLEAYASAGAILAVAREHHPNATIADLAQAARDGQPSAQRLLEDAGLYLGWGLAAAASLINPDVIVVGGDLASAGDGILEAVRTGLRRHALTDAGATVIALSTLGSRASLIGGLLVAADHTELFS